MEHIKPTLDALAQGLLRNLAPEDRVLAAWRHVCGPQAADHAHAASFRNTTLTVHVDDPAWLATLTHLRGQYCARLRTLTALPVEHLDLQLRPTR